ncbi:nidogen-1-like [Haliotis rufescens]|uniref:nidogen-1-like n=1 Tax=Haliotis rufescens TaxID=6454 RepID=UPI001EB09596|nr:nidogen-1-like [Haliotis rufescens]
MRTYLLLTAVGVYLSVLNVSGVPKKLFYPFGSEASDFVLQQGDDVSSNEFALNTSIAFFDQYYRTLYINSNGHLSFLTELPGYRPSLILPIGFNVIAAFFADVDTRAAGQIFYRETSNPTLLERAATSIQAHFRGQGTFEPTSLFIATWDNVGYFNSKFDKVNTFQIVIASDNDDSFAFFHYLDRGMAWIMGDGKEGQSQLDVPAQAGFEVEDGRNLKLPNSGTTSSFVNDTNVNIPGAWMFHIGYIEGENIQPADLNTGEVIVFPVDTGDGSCLEGTRMCHVNARCVDFTEGFCCECLPPSYGNGKTCLEPGVPQRLNGKVRGTLNGITLYDLDMHTYVVTSDGRAYSAISRVPPELGTAMQTLSAIGGIIGWMFAVPTNPRAKNGYAFTGGEFNRTATVTFLFGNMTYVVNVQQKFFGHDALNNLRMETTLNGDMPPIETGAKVVVDDHKENFKKLRPGLIKARSSRTFRINDVAYRYTWDQTIMFAECTADPDVLAVGTVRLSVGRNFVFFDSGNQVVRFAQSNKVGMLTGSDPCRDAAQNCAAEADCIPEGETYRCVCRQGYSGDGGTCEDIDECSTGTHSCDSNARCFNVRGTFQCQCQTGFRGDGRTCQIEVQLCGDIYCGENGRCVYDSTLQQPVCECNTGFAGNGVDCDPIEFGCNEVDNCGSNAQCVYDEDESRYVCECVDGFSGDGFSCETTDERSVCLRCDGNAACVMDVDRFTYRCQCNVGYSGDGFRCSTIDPCVECSVNAQCDFDQSTQAYQCRCRAGFYGDGRRCEAYDCKTHAVCDTNAECVTDPDYGNNYCRCSAGYRGDGRRCVLEGCRSDDDCDSNARCGPDPRDTNRNICRCVTGYEGDGRVCIQRVQACNQVNNCAREAECIYDPDVRSYRCQCRADYQGDGRTCTRRDDIPDCYRDPRLCDPNASCVQNVDHYVCMCNQDFVGDGRSCRAFDGSGNFLVYAQGYSISRVPYQGTGRGQMLIYVPGQLAVGLDTDCSEGFLYWTDVAGGQIRRARYDGTDIQTVLTGLVSPEGVAIDYISRNLYYTDSELDVVGVAKLDGSDQKTLFSSDIVNPRSIVLDPRRGVFYWTDWNRDKPQIEKANMDGTSRMVLVTSDLALPNGLTLDDRTQQLCWGDAGTKRIECIRSDGLGRRILYDKATYPFDVTYFNNVLYWSDWETKGIPNINRDGGAQANDPLNLAIGGNGRVYGVTAVRDQCPRVTNGCAVNNGGCRYLCLPSPSGGRSCACPDDIDPRRCNEVALMKKRK